jgi:hypothetical protein
MEYDSYVGDIAAKLRNDATDNELLEYLRWAESVHMGFGQFDAEHAGKVIALLRGLKIP